MGLILWIATNNPQNYLYAGSQGTLLMSRFLVILLGLVKKNPREHKSFLTYLSFNMKIQKVSNAHSSADCI